MTKKSKTWHNPENVTGREYRLQILLDKLTGYKTPVTVALVFVLIATILGLFVLFFEDIQQHLLYSNRNSSLAQNFTTRTPPLSRTTTRFRLEKSSPKSNASLTLFKLTENVRTNETKTTNKLNETITSQSTTIRTTTMTIYSSTTTSQFVNNNVTAAYNVSSDLVTLNFTQSIEYSDNNLTTSSSSNTSDEIMSSSAIIKDHPTQSTTTTTSTTTTDTIISTTSSTLTTTTTTAPPISSSKKTLVDELVKQQACRRANVYEPTELTDSSSTLFGYPIVQTVSCYGSKLELRCPPSQLIRIHSAYYGNQLSPNYCNPDMDSVCYRAMSSDYVIVACENRTQCDLLVSDRVLGSPCPADTASSQLFVQYQCLDKHIYDEVASQCVESVKLEPICPSLEKLNSIQEIQIYEQHWCEPNTMHIQCENDTVINVICTFYGIDPTLRCDDMGTNSNSSSEQNRASTTAASYENAPTSCFSKTSMFKVTSECNGRRTCTFSGEISFEADSGFTNACHGYPNMLFVQWECVQAGVTRASASSQLETSLSAASAAAAAATDLNDMMTLTTTNTMTATRASLGSNENIYDDYFSNSTTEDNCLSAGNSSWSAYEPVFLSNSTQAYLGYPISQQIVCQNSRLIILCPLDLVIHIYAAYYGIQSGTMSPTCLSSSSSSSSLLPPHTNYNSTLVLAKCYTPSVLETSRKTCEGSRSCELKASSSHLTSTPSVPPAELCPNSPKQLFVQYQCVHRKTLTTTVAKCRAKNKRQLPPVCNNSTNETTNVVFSNTWCNGSNVNITCPNGNNNSEGEARIRLLCTFYGVHPSLQSGNNSCHKPSSSQLDDTHHEPVCYFEGSMQLLSEMCNGRASCSIDVSLFGALAASGGHDESSTTCGVGLERMFYAQWQCV